MFEQIYNFKIGLRYVATMLILLVISASGIIFWASQEQERTAIQQARDFSVSVHQMTMAGLTGMMLTGNMGQRALFLDQIKQSNNIKRLQVLRGEPVAKQYGAGTEEEQATDAVEREVLKTGEPYIAELEEGQGSVLRVVMPTHASKDYLGKNCLMCHTVPEGTVLGAVSMTFDLGKVEQSVADFRFKIAFATIGFCSFILIVIYWGTSHYVTRPLNDLTRGLRVIAEGEGDLTHRLKVVGEDEIAQAAAVFNQVMEKFRDLILHVRESADQVSAAARELLGTAHQVNESSALQQDRSNSAAGAMEQIASRMASVAANTERVHRLSQDSLGRTNDGNQSLRQLASQMQRVESSVNDIATAVTAFIQNTDSITEMTDQVRDIAEQTNMLALNAAIEAARAGEQGRGFAVVADEVRNLAEKSAQSANQIDEVTQDLTRQSKQVEGAISTGLDHLRSSRETMIGVSDILGAANTAVEEVVKGLTEIAAATDEQREASREVAGHVDSIAVSASENNQRAGQTEQAVKNLEHLAESLQDTVRRFRV